MSISFHKVRITAHIIIYQTITDRVIINQKIKIKLTTIKIKNLYLQVKVK